MKVHVSFFQNTRLFRYSKRQWNQPGVRWWVCHCSTRSWHSSRLAPSTGSRSSRAPPASRSTRPSIATGRTTTATRRKEKPPVRTGTRAHRRRHRRAVRKLRMAAWHTAVHWRVHMHIAPTPVADSHIHLPRLEVIPKALRRSRCSLWTRATPPARSSASTLRSPLNGAPPFSTTSVFWLSAQCAHYWGPLLKLKQCSTVLIWLVVKFHAIIFWLIRSRWLTETSQKHTRWAPLHIIVFLNYIIN